MCVLLGLVISFTYFQSNLVDVQGKMKKIERQCG